MKFEFHKPALALQPFIDMYWHISGYINHTEAITLMPDGGISLIINLGEDIVSSRFASSIKYNVPFIIGPMMQTDVQLMHGEVLFFGIKFKPGAFTHFYRYESLDCVADQFYEFNHKQFPDAKKTIQYFVSYLNQFYLNRLSIPKISALNIISDITQDRGRVKIENLAKKHFTTVRQLERIFKQQIGLSPKEFINLERFTNAFVRIQKRKEQSLSDIAWDCGYYDHAHLTNDFKRYTGKAPTDFILSDFSKTIVIEP